MLGVFSFFMCHVQENFDYQSRQVDSKMGTLLLHSWYQSPLTHHDSNQSIFPILDELPNYL